MEAHGERLKTTDTNVYETPKLVSEYLAFHYTPASEYIPWPFRSKEHLDFPVRCAQLCLKHKNLEVQSRALDIGCAVGRSTFELARGYQEVLGIDYSSAFVAACQQLKEVGEMPYFLKTEGDLGETKIAKVDPDIDRTRVKFSPGDAANLGDLGQFGCVLAGNLICRMKEPAKFLNSLHKYVVIGGIAVLTTPFTWLEEYTPKENWLGGFVENGREVRGIETVKEMLWEHFKLLEEQDLPFVIRETHNKYQWTVSHATVWKRKL